MRRIVNCIDCKQDKPNSSKGRCNTCRNRHNYHTTPGAKEQKAAYYRANRERIKTYQEMNPMVERRATWRKLGMCPFTAQAVYEAADGVCEVCLITEDETGEAHDVDHDHTVTDPVVCVRGAVCSGCNNIVRLIEEGTAKQEFPEHRAYIAKHKQRRRAA